MLALTTSCFVVLGELPRMNFNDKFGDSIDTTIMNRYVVIKLLIKEEVIFTKNRDATCCMPLSTMLNMTNTLMSLTISILDLLAFT